METELPTLWSYVPRESVMPARAEQGGGEEYVVRQAKRRYILVIVTAERATCATFFVSAYQLLGWSDDTLGGDSLVVENGRQ